MSSSRYPDSSRYPRERSPYRDRRASTYTPGGYPPRGLDSHGRSNADSVAFPPRDVPRGPKSLVDAPRGPISGPSSTVPSGPREGRGRGFPGRGDGAPSLRDAPPLTSSTHNAREQHNSRDHWRADRDRDRDFRDRRPSPPRRSPIRDSRDFSLNIDRARRNSRDGPLSAGSTYSDPPLGTGSSYRGCGIGRGRGMSRDFSGDFRPRGRGYHNDDRDRHHDPRDARDRMYRPRSRSREPIRRDRDLRDDREFDRRERDDRRFREEEPRRYDSYQGSASFKPSLRNLDTHRGSASADPRNLPNTPTGTVAPHSAHHPAGGDRPGPPGDTYSRRTSVAAAPLSAKDARRESDQNDLIASRAEISKERYGPRASSPPASVPAFGFSNVWRNPALDAKPAPPAQVQKPVAAPTVSAPTAPSAPAPPPSATVAPAPASTPTPASTAVSASASVTSSITTSAPAQPVAPPPASTFSGPTPVAVPPPLPPPPVIKPAIPPGLTTIPPTGPKADRLSDRPHADIHPPESKTQAFEPSHGDTFAHAPPFIDRRVSAPSADISDPKSGAQTSQPHSPPVPLGIRNRAPPSGPQAAIRPNVSPSFSRPLVPPYVPRDASPGAIPSGPRHSLSHNASPKSAPVNIPTGPKADRANAMAPRQPMYGAPERPPFANPRVPLGGSKNLQWVRPGLNRPPTIPTKREFPTDDRDRAFGTAPKAPRLENNNNPSAEPQRLEQPRPDVRVPRSSSDGAEMKFQKSPEPKPIVASPRPSPIKTRRSSDISMPDVSPVKERPSLAAVPVPKDMEDSDEDFDLDEEDFAESEAKYHREKALLEAKLVDLTASQFRATTPLKEIVMLSNLSLEHLPQEEPKIADEEVLSSVVEPPPPESIATELLTPRAEEPEDVVMEDKQEPPMAPATRALRLRPEQLTEREATPPDVSALPYLVSGPPTPLSHPDHDRLSVPDSVLLAIRDKLKKDAAPEADPEDVLKEYAATYKRWRLSIQELDRDRGHDDQETTQYEPALKATTPDVNSASVAGFLDIPHTTGRRGYTSRFPTELDIEQVLKESLKTAEEERMGKKDKEPKILWDPEREATVPSLLSPYEIQRRRFIDTNFQREPGQGVLVYHYEPPEDDFTEAEHKVMVQHYRDQYAKKWGKLAEIIHKEVGTSRTYKDTINHYYATKWNKEFKHKTRRRGVGVRKRARKTVVERSDAHGDDTTTPLPLTDSGRPRRQAAPTFGTDADVDTTGATPTPGRQRRQPDVDGTQEKVGRRGKTAKEKGGRKAKSQQPLAAAPAPAPSPVKVDRKEKVQGVKAEEDLVKRQPEIPMPKQPIVPTQPPPPPAPLEEANIIQSDHSIHHGLGTGIIERPRSNTNTRLGPSSYWSVTEQTDFQRNVAHFGTDWAAIAHHMGTKTQTMVKNQYLRLVESGNSPELARLANEADKRRERGEDLGPPPTPTPAPKRRYDNTQTSVPRTLAPTPEVAELSRSPSMQPLSLPQFSPPHGATSRFPSIAQAPQPATNMVPTAVPVSVSEAPPAAPSKPRQLSPPPPAPPAQAQQRSSAVHHHNVLDQQHKPHSNGPRAGYFLDGPAPRGENRITSQQPIAHPPRAIQQQLQPHLRGQEQLQPHYRPAVQQDRESQARLEQQQEHDAQTRYQQHSRRISQEVPFPRQFPQNMQTSTQAMPSIQSTSGAASPEGRTLPQQQSRYGPPAPISNNTSQPDLTGQTPGSMAVPPQIQSRSSLRTPPVKEEPRQEPRHYPLPGHPPHSQQPPQIQAQPSVYPRPTQAPPPSSAPPPPPAPSKPASEPKKSSLLSLLNDVPEEPKRKKPNEAPSHTPTPQQQTPVAPPPPSNHATAPRRDFYSDSPNTQSPYSRSVYAQPANQPPQQHPPSARQIVDHASEQQASRHHPRESWQQRSYQPGQGSIQQANSLNSPHAALSQPNYGDSRMLGNHRSLLAQHNTSRPSPPPIGAYGNSPHMHSRNSSMSGPSSQQPRHSMSANNAPQAPATASQILQPNPYAQVEPPGNNPQQAGTVSMRSGPHHPTAAQQRDMQGRNEQAQVHNASLPYSGPQTPGEHHPGHQHLRGPSVSEQYRSREARDYRGFESQIPDRDSSRELAERGEYLLREQRESLLPRTGGPPQGHQDLRYQPPPQTERGYATQRSHTPLSRPEHTTHHATLQHPIAHSILPENRGLQYGQRPQEEPPHAYREAYPVRDDRHADRMREEQAYHARMRTEELMHRDRELRERDARYGQEMMRRDSRISGPPPPPPPPQQPHHEHRASHGGPMDWTSAVPRQQDRWPQQQQQQHPHQHQR